MVTATVNPTESARETFRAHRARIARRPLPVAGVNDNVWDILNQYRPLFTLYDVMEVARLGKAHAILAIRAGLVEKRVKRTTFPGRYLAVKAPCRALIIVEPQPCALLAPRDLRRDVVNRFWVSECMKPHAQVMEELAEMFHRPVRLADCPF